MPVLASPRFGAPAQCDQLGIIVSPWPATAANARGGLPAKIIRTMADGGVRSAAVISLLPVRLQGLGDLRHRLCGPALQEVGQTARQNGRRLVGAHPAQTLQCVLFSSSFNDLGQRSDVVGGRKTDDPLGGLLDRHAGIADRMA